MRRPIALALLVALAGWQPFRSPNPDVEAGNKALAEGRYDDALAAYDRAAQNGSVDPDGLAYDRGTAELAKAAASKDAAEKDRLVGKALEDLKQAQHSRDARVRGSADYNRGNALMGQDKLDDAIEAYKQALREQPDFEDARTNLELALRRRQKKQQQQQQQQQGQQGQGQQGQQGQNQQGQGQGQQGQNQQGQGQQGQNQQGQGQQGQGSQQQQGSGGGSQQQQQGSGGGSQQQQGQGQGSQQQQQGQGQGSQQQQQGSGAGSGSNQQQGSQGSGSNQQNGQQGQANGQGQPGQNNRGRPTHDRGDMRGPQTPRDHKLDELEDFSRRMQRDGARRHSTGHPTDPDKDW